MVKENLVYKRFSERVLQSRVLDEDPSCRLLQVVRVLYKRLIRDTGKVLVSLFLGSL